MLCFMRGDETAVHLLWTPAPLDPPVVTGTTKLPALRGGQFATSTSSWHKGATGVSGFGGGVEQVGLWQTGNGLFKRSLSVPSARCLPLTGPAAGAGGRKGTGVS